MRLLIVAAGPLDVAHGSGMAMSVPRLRLALRDAGIASAVLTSPPGSHVGLYRRRHFNRALESRSLSAYDAVLGVDGDGWLAAVRGNVPFVALIKAMFSRVLAEEHGLALAVRIQSRWERAAMRAADCVVAPSRAAAREVVRAHAVDPSRVRVIPEPFALEGWRSMLPRRERDGTRVLCVAHLYPRKRVADLLDAWPLVLRDRPDARLDIVGDGPELRSLVRRSSHVPAVYLHGHVGHPAVMEFYARADVFCLPSAHETFGYAAVEAMASGLPVVVADAGAAPEVVEGAVAEVAAVGDSPAIARAVLRALDSSVRADAAERNPTAVSRFEGASVARALRGVVEELRQLRLDA